MGIQVADPQLAEAQQVEDVIEELSRLVCKEGPELLTRGMKNWEANASILACLKSLLSQRDELIFKVRKYCTPSVADLILQSEAKL